MNSNDKVIILTSFYYKPHIGGVENSLAYLAKSGLNNDYRVILVCSDSSTNNKRLGSYEFSEGVEIFRFRNYHPKIPLFKIFGPIINTIRCSLVAKKLTKQIARSTVVITRHYITGYAFYLAGFNSVKYLIPGIVEEQDAFYLRGNKNKTLKSSVILWFIIPQNIWLQRRAIKTAVQSFVFSKYLQYECQRKFKISPTIVKPGVDKARFYFRDRAELRKKMGFSENEFIALCIGRITKHKGFEFAIEAFKNLQSQNVRLLIVGSGPEKENLQQLALQMNLESKIEFLDHSISPELFYSISNVFLMTSIHETFGQTIIESMASNIPVIAFDSNEVDSASNEIIIQNDTGFIIPFSSCALSNCLDKCINQVDRLNEMGRNGNSIIARDYQWDNLFSQLIL